MVTTRSLISREIAEVMKPLETLTYKQRRDFLWQRSGPRLSRFLYKFRPLQTEEDANRLREIMLMSKLWLSPVAAFNDPFDMSAKVIIGTVDERNRFRRELIQQGVRFKDIAPAVRRLMTTSESESTAIARELLRRDITAAGVCSFAGDPRSTLMWSHYGSNHKGLCLVFERARDPRTFLRAMEVEYSDEYPVVNMVKDLLRGFQAVILRKHACWRYEKESRIIFLGGANMHFKFRPEALRAIITGCRMNDDARTQLDNLLAERSSAGMAPVEIYRCSLHESKYKLVISRAK